MIISIATNTKATRYFGFDYFMYIAVRLTSGVSCRGIVLRMSSVFAKFN